jgi:hypothetical protein
MLQKRISECSLTDGPDRGLNGRRPTNFALCA